MSRGFLCFVVQPLWDWRGSFRRRDDPVGTADSVCRKQGMAGTGFDRVERRRLSPVPSHNATVHGWSPRLRGDLVVHYLLGVAMSTGQILIKSDGTRGDRGYTSGTYRELFWPLWRHRAT
jgi:hypothetical protein